MPPQVTYWTGTWDPAKEAISKEINALRTGRRAHAPVVAFSPAESISYSSRTRVLTLPVRAWPVLRAAAAVLERRGDVTHVFGGNTSWHLLRALGRRPILLTAVVSGAGAHHLPLAGVARVAVETESAVDEWKRLGVAGDRIAVVPPGIDTGVFAHLPPPAGDRFTLLFASTPADPAEIDARGIPLLVDLARARPDVDILVPWRIWGDVDGSRRAIAALHPPSNFLATFENAADMRAWYARAHATIACFGPGTGKVVPNFVLEGLACGRPCILTEGAGLSREVTRARAGLVAARTPAAVSAAVSELASGWAEWSARARMLAEQEFDAGRFLARYDALYQTIHDERRS